MANQLRKVEWSSVLAVGEDKIDEQHLKFLDIINHAIDAYQNNNQILIQQSLNELMDYSRYHFKHERELMQKYNYPDINAHIGAHAEFMELAMDLNDKFKSNNTIIDELLHFVQNWLLLHIQDTDRKLGSFLKRKM